MLESGATEADFQQGRAALTEITPADTIGEPLGSRDEGDGVVSVYFQTNLAGYPGWRWTASIAHLEGAEPSVLETELTPGEGALLAPDWVPWVDRLAEYEAAQEAAGAGDDDDVEEDADDDDLDDEDVDDDDVDEGDLLQAGDLDGVDIDDAEENTADDISANGISAE